MSDDIVTRLRELGRYVNTEGGRWFEPITTEAAHEIERLRKLTSELASMMMPFALLMTTEEQEKVMKVVRSE